MTLKLGFFFGFTADLFSQLSCCERRKKRKNCSGENMSIGPVPGFNCIAVTALKRFLTKIIIICQSYNAVYKSAPSTLSSHAANRPSPFQLLHFVRSWLPHFLFYCLVATRQLFLSLHFIYTNFTSSPSLFTYKKCPVDLTFFVLA